MKLAAEDLEFEEAAKVRDEIHRLEELDLGLNSMKANNQFPRSKGGKPGSKQKRRNPATRVIR